MRNPSPPAARACRNAKSTTVAHSSGERGSPWGVPLSRVNSEAWSPIEYAVRITRRWPVTMNLIQRTNDGVAPMAMKAAVRAGCCTVSNADVASR